MDERTRKKIKALVFYLQNKPNRQYTATRLAQIFDLDVIIVRALAQDQGVKLRDTTEVVAIDDDMDTERIVEPKKPSSK